MQRVRIGDMDLAVVDRGHGPAILLVHGFPLDHRMWERQFAPLAERFRVIAPDLRGFGESVCDLAPDAELTMERHADDLAALLDALGIEEPITFCGLSMGGYIAWQFHRRHAARLRRLVLCDTRAAPDSPQAAAARLTMAEDTLAQGAAPVANAMPAKLLAADTISCSSERVATVRQWIMDQPPAAIAAAQRGMARRIDARPLLSTIQTPTLVIVGEHDAISPPDEMRSIAKAIPGAELAIIPEAGHLSPWENAPAFNAVLLRFLDAHR